MCGIAAIFGYRDDAPAIDVCELRAIRDHMVRRGPDGYGEWLSADGRVGLGHRRLAIIDLSERGAQPMVSDDATRVVTFNGEIYNYRELRAGLEGRGYLFRSNSDTEVLLALYAQRGAAMVKELRGMFAFALWDTVRRELLLARDPYGIKPLFYADDGSTVRVASQVKALLAGGRVSAELDQAGVAGFYVFGSVPEPLTMRRSVRCLEAGSTLTVSAAGVAAPRRYYCIARVLANAASAAPRDAAEQKALVHDALRDSVRHHLIADVPVGAFLSAGVDSGTLVSLMRDFSEGEIRTVTLAFEEFRGTALDEAPLAEKQARSVGTRHETRLISEADLHACLPRILDAMDQPTIDGINSWLVCMIAHEHGLKVALSGLGGDELFGGYPSFRQIPLSVRSFGLLAKIPRLGETFRQLWQPLSMHRPRWSPKIGGTLLLGGTYAGAYLLRRGLFMPWELDAVMGHEEAADGLERLRPLEYVQACLLPDPGTPYSRVACLEASLYMRNQLLRDTDWASMYHSLEVRVPLVDAALLERLAPLLVQLGGLRDKAFLASSPSRPVGADVLRRRKTGFGLPLQAWVSHLTGELDAWRAVPALAQANCHWSRRMAYSLVKQDRRPSADERRADSG